MNNNKKRKLKMTKKSTKKTYVRNIDMNKCVLSMLDCFLKKLIKPCQNTLSTVTRRQRPKNQKKIMDSKHNDEYDCKLSNKSVNDQKTKRMDTCTIKTSTLLKNEN